jgi:ribonuclease P/MRP protein subunit POP1
MKRSTPESTPELNNKQRKKLKQQERLELPRVLIVPDEITARKQEIELLQDSIKNASEFSGNVRVFQTVNRYQRRRAASLNPKRLPKSVQPRAIAQLAKDPQKTRKMVRKRFTTRTHPEWLETHCWHAKRMFMIKLGKVKVSLKSHQKGAKSTFRALRDEAIARDISYHQILFVKGDLNLMDQLFQRICDPTEPKILAPRFDTKYGTIWAHGFDEYPRQAICKIGFLKHPQNEGVWLWIPSFAYDDVFTQLYRGLYVLENKSIENLNVKIENVTMGRCSLIILKDDYVRFEMRGPRSHSVLQHVLVPEETFGFNEWQRMNGLTDAKQVPPNTVISLEIQDPRIK